MDDERRVVIAHDDGRQYAVLPADFDREISDGEKSYKGQGFRLSGLYEDGTEVESAAGTKQRTAATDRVARRASDVAGEATQSPGAADKGAEA